MFELWGVEEKKETLVEERRFDAKLKFQSYPKAYEIKTQTSEKDSKVTKLFKMWGWVKRKWAELISKVAIDPMTGTVFPNPEPIKPKSMPPIAPVTKKIPLKADQYYQGVYPKKYIILHHTAGSTAASAIAHWATTPDHIATPYVIDRDGTIYEVFDPKFWAYHLGVKGNSSIEKASIGIEIVAWGQLTLKEGKYYTYTKKALPDSEVVAVEFRGHKYYQRYTPEQIAALKVLLPYLLDRFKIVPQTARKDFWEYSDPSKLPPGIWSHTTVRKDKVDVFPQPEIVELVYGL